MDTCWATADSLYGRIDATYYRPKYVAIERDRAGMHSRGISSRQVSSIGSIEYGYMPIEDYWDDKRGHPFIRTTNFGTDLDISASDLKFVNRSAAKQDNNVVQEGDVLVIQCGNYTGRTVYVGRRFSGWVFPSFALRIRPKGKFDGGFLAALLFSSFGRIQLERSVTVTSVRPNTTKPGVGAIWVPYPGPAIQRAIGNKVRKAERLRELAAADRRSGTEATLAACGTSQLDSVGRHGFAAARWIYGARLDAKFYLPSYLRLRSEMNQISGGQTLRDLVKQVSNGCEIRDFVEHGRPYLVVGNLSGMDLRIDDAPHISANEKVPKKAIPTVGDLLIVRTGSIGQASWLLPEETGSSQLVLSSHLIRFVLKDATWAPFLAAYFTHGPGRSFIDQIAYGAVQPQLSQDELLAVPVPRAGSDVRTAVADVLGSWRRQTRNAESAVDEARAAVESLIDGTLDEPALLAEGETIEHWLAENPSPHEQKS